MKVNQKKQKKGKKERKQQKETEREIYKKQHVWKTSEICLQKRNKKETQLKNIKSYQKKKEKKKNGHTT